MLPLVPPFLWSLAVPFVLGAAILTVAGRRAGAAPIAFGLAFAVAYVGLLGAPRLPAGDAVGWLFWVAAAATVAGLAETTRSLDPEPARLALRVVAVGALLCLLLRQPYLADWSRGVAAAHLTLLGLGATLSWTALVRCGDRLAGARLPLLLVALASGLALILALTGTASLALLVGSQAAVATVALGITGIGRPATPAPGGTATFAILLVAASVVGCYFADTPRTCAALLAAAPVLALAAAPHGASRHGQTLALAAALAAIAVAVATAMAASTPPGTV